MKTIFYIFLSVIFSASACAEETEINPISLKSKLANGDVVDIFIEQKKFTDSFIYTKPIVWGAEFRPPRKIISRLTVNLDDNSSWVRFSAYSDLVDLKNAKLITFDEGFQIVIDGGESSTHYIAHLDFDSQGFLKSRKVYSPKFPDEVWEETQYSFIRRTDM